MTRELDAQVAERVMGWRKDGDFFVPPDERMNWAARWDENGIPHWMPAYSTDISAAWLVVEKMKELATGHHTQVELSFGNGGWRFSIFFKDERGSSAAVTKAYPTAPEAICKAALKAVEDES